MTAASAMNSVCVTHSRVCLKRREYAGCAGVGVFTQKLWMCGCVEESVQALVEQASVQKQCVMCVLKCVMCVLLWCADV